MEWSDDDLQRMEEIRNLPTSFVVEAVDWWNNKVSQSIKNFIVVSSYYEWLALQSESADDVVQLWDNPKGGKDD